MIDPNRVEEIVVACLFTDEEYEGESSLENLPDGAVVVEGILNKWAFHPGRLESHRAEVEGMLAQLPPQFFALEEGGEGGWTFLNACMVRPEDPTTPFERWPMWTGLHVRMDQLFSLGQALGRVTSQVPRSMWAVLPGGMPYYSIHLQGDPKPAQALA